MILRVAWCGLALLLMLGAGCSGKPAAKPSTPKVESQRPPLRVLVVGQEDVGPVLIQRWRGASQQELEVVSISEAEWLSSDTCRTDVVIFPARDLADAVERKWLSPLPASLEKLLGATSSDEVQEFRWPSLWKSQVMYAKQAWGVPLGCSLLWVATAGADSQENWTLTQLNGLATPASSLPADQEVEGGLDRSALVDRYVMLLLARGSMSMSSGVLFQPSNMRPRLLEPLHLGTALELAKYVEKGKLAWGMSHEAMWQQLALGKVAWGLSQPGDWMHRELVGGGDIKVSRLRREGSGESDSGILVDTGGGWIACQAQATRQSSVASYFLEWIDQEDQREALHRISCHIWPRKSGLGKQAALRPELAAYYRQSATALDRMDVVTEFRLKGGSRYRAKLAEALAKIVQSPEQASRILEECNQDWEKITEELGRDGQRVSYERCLQLSGMSGT